MSQNLQNFAKFQKCQLDNLVDFEKCCKAHIFLQKSEPIQPKTSSILPKFCQTTPSDVKAWIPQLDTVVDELELLPMVVSLQNWIHMWTQLLSHTSCEHVFSVQTA